MLMKLTAVVFIDTHYNKSNPEELKAFERETEKLWKVSLNRKPFECLTRYELRPPGVELPLEH